MVRKFVATLSVSLVLLPLSFVYAHANPELEAAIESQITKDPRTANLTTDQLHKLVDALAEQAEMQGMSAQDILNQQNNVAPQPDSSPATDNQTCPFVEQLCAMNATLGLSPDSVIVPISLGFLLVLAFLLFGLKGIHHMHSNAPSKRN